MKILLSGITESQNLRCSIFLTTTPDDNKENALYKLRIELKLNPNLRHLVSKNARRYSPKDVKQITDELGDPY